jgi:hypothetical protein
LRQREFVAQAAQLPLAPESVFKSRFSTPILSALIHFEAVFC